jgi:serine/threonine protein phosphatase 1
MGFLMNWMRRGLPFRKVFRIGTIAPDNPLCVIGDVHGCLELLEDALARARLGDPETRCVVVGDFIDRGANSRGVLERLFAESQTDAVVCLRGNHEDMMLSAIDNPSRHMLSWIRNGGEQTLDSYGIELLSSASNLLDVDHLKQRLTAAMGDTLIAWLRGRPSIWTSGNVAMVHAGADPDVPLQLQDENNFIWGHDNFRKLNRTDGIWIVHGHTIVPRPVIVEGVVSIDTGAYRTGHLTMAHIKKGQVEFTQT